MNLFSFAGMLLVGSAAGGTIIPPPSLPHVTSTTNAVQAVSIPQVLPPATGKWKPGASQPGYFVRSTVGGLPSDWVVVTNVNPFADFAVNAYGSNELAIAISHRTGWTTNWITNHSFGTFSNDVFTPPRPPY